MYRHGGCDGDFFSTVEAEKKKKAAEHEAAKAVSVIVERRGIPCQLFNATTAPINVSSIFPLSSRMSSGSRNMVAPSLRATLIA